MISFKVILLLFRLLLHSKSDLFLSILFYKQSRNAHSLKCHTEQTLNLLPFLEVVCSTADSRILCVYFRSFLVIIHELKIKGLFILRQNKVNQNRMYLLSYFPLCGALECSSESWLCKWVRWHKPIYEDITGQVTKSWKMNIPEMPPQSLFTRLFPVFDACFTGGEKVCAWQESTAELPQPRAARALLCPHPVQPSRPGGTGISVLESQSIPAGP